MLLKWYDKIFSPNYPQTLLKGDKKSDHSLLILRVISKKLKSDNQILKCTPAMLRPFLFLNLTADLKQTERIDDAKKYKKSKKRRRKTLGRNLVNDLEEGESHTNQHVLFARQEELLRELFVIYLRILKKISKIKISYCSIRRSS